MLITYVHLENISIEATHGKHSSVSKCERLFHQLQYYMLSYSGFILIPKWNFKTLYFYQVDILLYKLLYKILTNDNGTGNGARYMLLISLPETKEQSLRRACTLYKSKQNKNGIQYRITMSLNIRQIDLLELINNGCWASQ